MPCDPEDRWVIKRRACIHTVAYGQACHPDPGCLPQPVFFQLQGSRRRALPPVSPHDGFQPMALGGLSTALNLPATPAPDFWARSHPTSRSTAPGLPSRPPTRALALPLIRSPQKILAGGTQEYLWHVDIGEKALPGTHPGNHPRQMHTESLRLPAGSRVVITSGVTCKLPQTGS